MDWSRLRKQIDDAWQASGRSQKEVLARASIKARQSINHWVGGRNLPELENLAAYAEASEAQLIIELVPKGNERRLMPVSDPMGEAARVVEGLDDIQRAHVMRFLRDAPHFTAGDWRGLQLLLNGLEEDLGRATDVDAATSSAEQETAAPSAPKGRGRGGPRGR